MVLDGIQAEEITTQFSLSASFTVGEDAANRSQQIIKNASWYWTGAANSFAIGRIMPNTDGVAVDKVYAFRILAGPTTGDFLSGVSGETLISNCVSMSVSGTSGMTTVSHYTLDNVVFTNVTTPLTLSGKQLTLKNCKFWGGNSSGGTVVQSSVIAPLSFFGNYFDNNTLAISFGANGTTAKAVESNSFFGSQTANTSDFGFSADGYFDYSLVNPTGALTIDTTNEAATVSGSHFRVTNYNLVSSDFRAWYTEGYFLSNGTSLEQYTNQTTDTLAAVYNLKTGAISSFALRAYVTCTIGNAAYYAGVYTLPKMVIAYDIATTVTATATATTSAQTLVADLAPSITADNNALIISLTTQTDAGATNSKVTWAGLTINVRQYGYIFSTVSIPIAETTDSVLTTIQALSINPFVVLFQASAHALTGISYNSGTNTITVSSNHTISELYDYFQDYANLNMSSAVLIDTVDGTTYTLVANLTVSTGVALSGAGKVLSMSAYTMTLTGTATFDGVYIDVSGRNVPLSLTGLVSGSTVQLYNTTNSTEIYNAAVSATSLLNRFAYSADKAVRIRVRKSNYTPYENTGAITNTGFTLNVNQQTDSIYTANAIDGSTVTEFSLSGATVKIYVSDTDNATSGQRMYNWYKYALATTTHIGDQSNLITAPSSYSYILDDTLQIYNQKTTPLFITGANLNNVSATGQVIDTGGTGPININGYFPFNSASDVGTSVWGTSTRTLTTTSTSRNDIG
jgi:hypothetical protein